MSGSIVWLDERDALILHDRLLALHGGAPGIRDRGLLTSAMARPRQHAAYGEQPDIGFLAALHTAAILQNHPFIDGNKRTGFVLGILFLELNGLVFTGSQPDAANAVIALAAGTMDVEGYAAFLAANAKAGGSRKP
ncbi:type II toxin-antitoxin system death-on-curing family toxin [Ferrovibrio xuzhouensis]|uniref:Type II toxin-antitoxin system death-on-curing family toxin n=1 Tax=Ferrovibrio xuzhouensis TaxID=1576914 RepID=A0ABV7VIW6_9PROT